ncbi:MAG: permease [Acidiferrobacterales bacterium]
MQAGLDERSLPPFTRVMIFAIVAIIGFAYVKWAPYYAKALLAQSHHAIGDSILSGKSASAPPASWNSAAEYAIAYGKAIWQALILGLLLGSGIKVLVPMRWINAMLGRLGIRSVALGSLFAIPCMMCTCCAAPVAVGMRQSRASIGSVVSWWVANPVLNPATLVFMGFVLGWGWTLFRIVLGIMMVFAVAYLAERYGGPHETVTLDQGILPDVRTPKGGFLVRWVQEFITLTIRLVPEYLVLVLLLGAARAWLFPALGVHHGIGWIVAMALAGTLFVIPTAGEVPIVQAMFALGMGVGPAGALIMTLPAVSLPSLAMIGRVFNLRTRLVIAGSVVLSGIVAGLVAMIIF